jgi:hypothetical protein
MMALEQEYVQQLSGATQRAERLSDESTAQAGGCAR